MDLGFLEGENGGSCSWEAYKVDNTDERCDEAAGFDGVHAGGECVRIDA